jgi:hypothetical protein
MKTLNFWSGVSVALVASLLGSIGYFALGNLLFADIGIRLVISGLAFAYGLYLLSCSQERTGRFTMLLLGSTGLIMLWLYSPSLTWFVLWQVLALWLLRAIYYHAGVLPALADLGLSLLSLAAACWALAHTGSLFLSLWCFFLTQALFVFIPKRSNLQPAARSDSATEFNRAYQTAEAAVRKLSSQA